MPVIFALMKFHIKTQASTKIITIIQYMTEKTFCVSEGVVVNTHFFGFTESATHSNTCDAWWNAYQNSQGHLNNKMEFKSHYKFIQQNNGHWKTGIELFLKTKKNIQNVLRLVKDLGFIQSRRLDEHALCTSYCTSSLSLSFFVSSFFSCPAFFILC